MPEITLDVIDEIKGKLEDIFTSDMEVDDYTGDMVPSIDDLPDRNRGLLLTNCSILFVDIRSSTQLSDRSQAKSMAKIYRAFARAMSMCIYSCGGRVRQIAGDRVMGVFVDDAEESAVNKALNAGRAIITVVEHIFNPLCKNNINNKTIECGVGIDLGRVLTTSVGIEFEGENTRDLVWAGKIANIASKHTDLAEAREIFVTNRFYNKLPALSKTNAEGEDIWKQQYRIKGNSIFEGYSVADYYLDCISDEEAEELKATSELLHAERSNENELNGINEGQIIAKVVEGVRRQTTDLLQRFESVIDREHKVNANEAAYSIREQTLTEKERAIAKREAELKEKEVQLASKVEYSKNQAVYEVKTIFLRENIDSFSLKECLTFMEEIQKLGEKIGKSSVEYKSDLYHWKLVRYFKEKEISIAFGIIIEQLTNKLNFMILPFKDDIVSIVKQLGKEQEYLEAVKYHIKTYKPRIENVIELRDILRKLGIDSQFVENVNLIQG
ncbi:adenylate/guanylate cyclase domain-containing protein [Bacillus paranthracis]|uniref:adenylate/guanylate cyclase domain-containing protein n=1 Tax=Bacillus sp. B4-WWTP-NA-D-NA-NA TaxID=2653216 RepID=UPI000771A312|nr:adenylate/guanylate cyclase domain-containing protein [Bacillus sp. B4-WWTP-NA-D-NA-NA]KAB7634564.1 adenylate/guanylate cyclase domain-containing protein [Bacillus sp. B4-WWTP-NA-D-NA-NA]KXI53367.1 hypothetical protein ACS45_08110 [Bacillus cereus]